VLADIGIGEIIYTFTEAVSFGGTTINGIEGEVSGGSFVPRPAADLVNNGEHFDIIVPTTGYEDIILSYATQRTSTGFDSQQILYSLNGIDFIEFTTFTDIPSSWGVMSIDFSNIPEVNDNPNFIVRIVLDGGTGTTGNNRFDNIRVEGFETEEEPPLPVELASFTASVTANNFVELEWVSETETNLLGYHIYRSNTEQLDDAHMANMQIIPATNTSETTVYTYVDENVEPGTYHYWLEYVDLDLTSGFHGPVTITLEEEPVLPPEVYVTRLQQNFPNPFNPETTIKYSLENDVENMSIKIYNILGQEVRTLKSGPHAKGEFTVVWDGRDNSGRNATSGIYFYRMSTPTYNQVHKMMLLK